MANKTKPTRKFEVGQRIWRYNENRRVYDRSVEWPKIIYGESYEPYVVVKILVRSYLIAHLGDSGAIGKQMQLTFEKVDRCFKTDQEKEDDVFKETHRNRLAELVRQADAATLRKVAAIFDAEVKADG